ncbi:MAG: hypothetical protein JWN23_613 [Rhodocyclales bacterium]|nr:hypothetical protein [Rhodocyclales bacterium]
MRAMDGLLIPQPIEVMALVDTGATICAIDEMLVRKLDLVCSGIAMVAGVFSMPATPYVYDISVVMVGDDFDAEPKPLVKAAVAQLMGMGYSMILGQSILFDCDLHLFGNMAGLTP